MSSGARAPGAAMARAESFAAPGALDRRQAEFAAAILDPTRLVPPGLVDPDGEPSASRFAVYRNNVVVGLVEALGAAFPVLRRLVGAAFFDAMARCHAAISPPDSPMMFDYGAGFPDFVAAFPPAAVLPYLADVARLERGWVEAYHAAEARPCDPKALGAIAQAEAGRLRLILHPSLRILRSAFPVVTIWRMNLAGGEPRPIDANCAENALVLRPGAEVEVRALPAGTAAFVAALAAGRPVVEGLKAALAEDARFDPAGALAGLLAAGAVTDWTCDPVPFPTAPEPAR